MYDIPVVVVAAVLTVSLGVTFLFGERSSLCVALFRRPRQRAASAQRMSRWNGKPRSFSPDLAIRCRGVGPICGRL